MVSWRIGSLRSSALKPRPARSAISQRLLRCRPPPGGNIHSHPRRSSDLFPPLWQASASLPCFPARKMPGFPHQVSGKRFRSSASFSSASFAVPERAIHLVSTSSMPGLRRELPSVTMVCKSSSSFIYRKGTVRFRCHTAPLCLPDNRYFA